MIIGNWVGHRSHGCLSAAVGEETVSRQLLIANAAASAKAATAGLPLPIHQIYTLAEAAVSPVVRPAQGERIFPLGRPPELQRDLEPLDCWARGCLGVGVEESLGCRRVVSRVELVLLV